MKFYIDLENDAGWTGIIFEDKNVSLNYGISDVGYRLIELLGGIIGISGSKSQILSIEDIDHDFECEKSKFEWILDQLCFQSLSFVRDILLRDINEPEPKIEPLLINVKFIFSKIKDSELINLKIIELYNEEKCVYNDNIELNDLTDNVLFSCSEILRKYGIIGYRLNFRSNFPVEYYLILKDFIRNEIKINKFKERNKTEELDIFKSDFSKEIEYLSSEN